MRIESQTRTVDWAASAQSIPVLPEEQPWTEAELHDVYSRLVDEEARLRADVGLNEEGLSQLMADRDVSGVDDADIGSAALEREQELALSQNLREMLRQCEGALQRIANSTYGVCDTCGGPVGKARQIAFPRAVTCLKCKQREERRR